MPRSVVTAAVLASLAGIAFQPPAASQQSPDVLAENIDRTISPRDDFFQYATGSWLERNPIHEDQTRWGVWNVRDREEYAHIRAISEKAAASATPHSRSERLLGDIWATGMDAATINAQGLEPLRPDFDLIDRVQSVEDVIDFVARMHRRHMLIDNYFIQPQVLFTSRIQPDETQSDRRIYSLAPGGITMGAPAYSSTDPQRVRVREALHDYLVKTFLRLHRDSAKARASADAVLQLEAQLAAGMGSGGPAQQMRLAELTQAAPTVGWNRYFQRLGVTGIETVAIRNAGYFRALDVVLRTAPIESWKDYLRFWLVRVNAPFLDDATYDDFFAYKRVVSAQPQPQPRWERVVWQEKNWFGLLLEEPYAREYLPKNEVARYQAVAASIRQAFRARVQGVDWIGDSTKRKALLKLDRLKISIGYPRRTDVDLSTLTLRRDSYVLNMIRAAEWFHEQEIKRLHSRVDPATSDLHPDIAGDAEYDRNANEVRMTSALTVPGHLHEDLDDAFVYGSTLLGHEVSHALDSVGRTYDADGNKVDWWTAADAAAFESRAQRLVDEYNALAPLEGLNINGKSTLSENMADLVGVRIALDAFKKTAQFKENRPIAGFTPLQRFFLAYAYAHMGQRRRDALAAAIRNGGYAPDRERVNGVVVNIPEFYEAFGVRPGDRMFRPENVRVRIWGE